MDGIGGISGVGGGGFFPQPEEQPSLPPPPPQVVLDLQQHAPQVYGMLMQLSQGEDPEEYSKEVQTLKESLAGLDLSEFSPETQGWLEQVQQGSSALQEVAIRMLKQAVQELGEQTTGRQLAFEGAPEISGATPSAPSLSSAIRSTTGSSEPDWTLSAYRAFITGNQLNWSRAGAEFKNVLIGFIDRLPKDTTMSEFNDYIKNYVGNPDGWTSSDGKVIPPLFTDGGTPVKLNSQDIANLTQGGFHIPQEGGDSQAAQPCPPPNCPPNRVPVNIKPPSDWDWSKNPTYTVNVTISGRPGSKDAPVSYFNQDGSPASTNAPIPITISQGKEVTLYIPTHFFSGQVSLSSELADGSFQKSPILFEITNDDHGVVTTDLSGVDSAAQADALLDFESNFVPPTAGMGLNPTRFANLTYPPQTSGTTENISDIINKMKGEIAGFSSPPNDPAWQDIFSTQNGKAPPVSPKNVKSLYTYYNEYLTQTYLNSSSSDSIQGLSFQAPGLVDGKPSTFQCTSITASYIEFTDASNGTKVRFDPNIGSSAWWDGGYEGTWATGGIQVFQNGSWTPFHPSATGAAAATVPALMKYMTAMLNVGFQPHIFKDGTLHPPATGITTQYLAELDPSYRYKAKYYNLYMRTGLDAGLNTYLFDYQDVLGMDNTRADQIAHLASITLTMSNVGVAPPPVGTTWSQFLDQLTQYKADHPGLIGNFIDDLSAEIRAEKLTGAATKEGFLNVLSHLHYYDADMWLKYCTPYPNFTVLNPQDVTDFFTTVVKGDFSMSESEWNAAIHIGGDLGSDNRNQVNHAMWNLYEYWTSHPESKAFTTALLSEIFNSGPPPYPKYPPPVVPSYGLGGLGHVLQGIINDYASYGVSGDEANTIAKIVGATPPASTWSQFLDQLTQYKADHPGLIGNFIDDLSAEIRAEKLTGATTKEGFLNVLNHLNYYDADMWLKYYTPYPNFTVLNPQDVTDFFTTVIKGDFSMSESEWNAAIHIGGDLGSDNRNQVNHAMWNLYEYQATHPESKAFITALLSEIFNNGPPPYPKYPPPVVPSYGLGGLGQVLQGIVNNYASYGVPGDEANTIASMVGATPPAPTGPMSDYFTEINAYLSANGLKDTLLLELKAAIDQYDHVGDWGALFTILKRVASTLGPDLRNFLTQPGTTVAALHSLYEKVFFEDLKQWIIAHPGATVEEFHAYLREDQTKYDLTGADLAEATKLAGNL
jgi:hypothetical protein